VGFAWLGRMEGSDFVDARGGAGAVRIGLGMLGLVCISVSSGRGGSGKVMFSSPEVPESRTRMAVLPRRLDAAEKKAFSYH
jgi:hypothetical protein